MQRHLTKYLAGEDDTSLDSPSPSLKLVNYLGEKSQPEYNWESLITTKSQDEEINSQFTILCLSTLPHHWYSYANPLGWR